MGKDFKFNIARKYDVKEACENIDRAAKQIRAINKKHMEKEFKKFAKGHGFTQERLNSLVLTILYIWGIDRTARSGYMVKSLLRETVSSTVLSLENIETGVPIFGKTAAENKISLRKVLRSYGDLVEKGLKPKDAAELLATTIPAVGSVRDAVVSATETAKRWERNEDLRKAIDQSSKNMDAFTKKVGRRERIEREPLAERWGHALKELKELSEASSGSLEVLLKNHNRFKEVKHKVAWCGDFLDAAGVLGMDPKDSIYQTINKIKTITEMAKATKLQKEKATEMAIEFEITYRDALSGIQEVDRLINGDYGKGFSSGSQAKILEEEFNKMRSPLKEYGLSQIPKTVIGPGTQFTSTPFFEENQTILQEAQKIVYGDRQADYGSATENFNNIAKLWEPILKTEVTPEQVGLCMIQLKVAREMNRPKRDNLVDIAGYAGTLEKVQKGE